VIQVGKETTKRTLKDMPMKKTTKIQRVTSAVKSPKKNVKANQKQSISPVMPKIPDLNLDKEVSPPPVLTKEESIEVPSTDIDRMENIPNRHKLSIDLNKSTSEEDPWEDRVETGETSKRKKLGKKRKVIRHIKKHNKQLIKKNSRLQKKMTKLVEKHNKLCDFSQKLMKKNMKLYWTTKVLKTKWL
jgi:hypothetical protein